MQNTMEALKNAILGFGWGYIAEWLLLFLLITFVYKTLKNNNAKRLIALYSVLIVAVGLVFVLTAGLCGENSPYNPTVYVVFIMLLSLFFLSLFATEIKREIWTGKRSVATTFDSARSAVGARAEEYIAGIVKAVQNLSKNNTGALIVLSNGNLPKEIIESGVSLGAHISSQLIEGIFINKAPLHDGAMIIYGDKIQAAGCFLPLTQREFPKDYGTRHRAGIGVTEVSDVSTIIVSEETGIVSTVRHGEITRYTDSEMLKKFLHEYYWKEFNAEGRK